ncbi:Cell surface protein IsdA, transfers heme from hemoglobin to apo-IsdC [Staphylococcus sp. 8AQ]|uniref:NEAT domain-containing protein n=1 Tax=Staphylococcus sp. 8AQ TaxID=2653174 RepID=UPI0012F14333|nr:NEAT domain-containing protein [Staphylococcus sp. 8AQ]VXC62166.1 Cell surface protein IsdA, transfers heme from hemoglobin to apo-IsdC [Staphylococcus sp. 8AQ]
MNKHYLNPKFYKENNHASLRRFTIGSATLLLSVLLYASNGENHAQAAETNQNNNQNTAVSPSSSQNNTVSEELNFQVQRDGSNEVSHMDEYMKHPGKVIKKDNQYYFQATLTNASWWKEYKFFDKNNQELTTNVVNDDTANDTKTLDISVEPGYTNITSRIHIVIPNLKYDHTYTTHLEFAKPIPTLGETNTNSDSNTASQPNNDVVTTPATGDNNNGATAPSTGNNNNAPTTPATGDNNNAPTSPATGDNNNAPTSPNTGDNNNAPTSPNTGDNNNAPTSPATGDNNNVPTTPAAGGNNNNGTNTNTGDNVGKDGKDGKGGKTGKKEDEGKDSKSNQNNGDKDAKNSQNSDDNKSKELPDTGKVASHSYFNELAMATIALFTSITMFVFRRKHSK